jgi:hypothetical protein
MSIRILLRDRTPVRRKHAVSHLLITVLCFAFSVTGTRVFLELTGYPQLGGGELHIAHVLWGGVFLFAASLLPLIWVNQWVLDLSAVFSGLGVGLFIDEVGKFITSTNDYFYPSAAPIVYAFFLLTVLVFVQVKRHREHSSRSLMYGILEDFAEVLDHDLSKVEYDRLMKRLDMVIKDEKDEQMVQLARSLQGYLTHKATLVVEHEPNIFERISDGWQKFSNTWLSKRKLRTIILLGLLVWAGWAVSSQTIRFLITNNVEQFRILIEQFMANELIAGDSGMHWFEAQIILEGSIGLIALIAVLFFLIKQDRVGTWIGITDLVFTLVVVNLLTFYFDQFSTIAFAAVQFLLLVLMLYYKRKYLDKGKA